MERGSSWLLAIILIWLQAAKISHSLPRPSEPQLRQAEVEANPTTTSFETQYPPHAAGARVLLPEAKGVYPTDLEREGRPSLLPFPTVSHRTPEHPEPSQSSDSRFEGDDTTSITTQAAATITTAQLPIDSSSVTQSLSSSITYTDLSALKTTLSTPSDAVSVDTSTLLSSSTFTTSFITQAPFVSEATITSSLTTSSVVAGPLNPPAPSRTAGSTSTMAAQDVFQPVSMGPIPSNIPSRNDHPVSRLRIENTTRPISTNKFYAGAFLGTQTNATFTHPYSLAWCKGNGTAQSWGMAISHIDVNMVAMGPPDSRIPGSPVSHYINPIGIQSMILSAAELNSSTVLTTVAPLAFSANLTLQPHNGSAQQLIFPVVQGMGYVTGVYHNLQPLVQSSVFFRSVVSAGSPKPGIFKYRVTLEDSNTWLVYVTPSNGMDPRLRLESTTLLRGPSGFSGIIQVAKNPSGNAGEKFYDNSAGVYPLGVNITGSVSNSTGVYNLTWQKAGKNATSTPLMMFALPHHVQSFDASTKSRQIDLQLRTTTKGNATAVIGESWTMVEPDLPVDMEFAPWSPSKGSVAELSPAASQVIRDVAPTELRQDMESQTNLDSMYYSGKALSKFATLVYTVHTLAKDPDLAASALATLKTCFARFVNNQQKWPLVYDSVWKGVVSSATYKLGDVGLDFGNTCYNDHHFHYGYFIHAASIIGSLDPSWIDANKEWVNMLVRDAGNGVANDPQFPFSRAFDWFHGHSWAKGLFESFDGKDEESTSEDAMFAYALKMWGKTIGDRSLEARGNLMLGILRRSFQNYFLMEDTNTNQPPRFIGNKVTGILFENKVDHTTYFGTNLEYIQGIHMLPLLPNSAYTRSKSFVAQEWDAMFSSNASTPAEKVDGGWKGVLYANLALIDPAASWEFFAQPNFNYSWIDGGASRTWYLAYAAGLGGGPS